MALAVSACGDDDRSRGGTDSGTVRDASPSADASGSRDAGGVRDAGSTTDAGEGSDAGAADAGNPADAGRDGGGSTGDCGDFGKPCTPSMGCPSGYECDEFRHRCLPVGRPICGGFAGATCDGPTYTECLYLTSADFGPCLTPEEATCACMELRDTFSCP